MTEMIYYGTHEPIVAEMKNLQNKLEERQRRLPLPFVQLDAKAQKAFCEDAERHVDFELAQNETLYAGMPLIAQGSGVYLTKNLGEPKKLVGRPLGQGQTVRGIIDSSKVIAIPPLSFLVERSRPALDDIRLSVLLKLTQAVFATEVGYAPLDTKYETFISLTYPGFTYARGILGKIQR